ncbi:Tll0287-like domain-containing protein [Gimibacter soli]|uniref:DUF3365 domain-containing protein n=1 Tax=Gimibacter soli TaxID=3024400 RepID=A0AAE9XV13_9PROT|nr:DUF3365 domain-containing protein [Gimibacter soli]WCL54228.1 DUF3365 domain-containing protein [Gimibacter soli]
MRQALLPTLTALVFTLPPVAATHGGFDGATLKARSAALADRYQAELMAQLQAALEAGGPAAAIEVCAEVAPTIAATLSAESGAKVGRTSLKVRNPEAFPTTTERAMLIVMAEAPLDAAGKPVERVWAEADATGTMATLHYMRAIPLKPQCAACHGEAIDPALLATIKARYPADAATGFKVGELRGAFTITWPKGMVE